VDRLWLTAIVAVGLILFVIGPSVADSSPRGQALVLESADWADTIMKEGVESVRADALRGAPLGFLTRWMTTALLLVNPTGDDMGWARTIACLIWVLSWWGLSRFIAGRRVSVREPTPWLVLCVLLASDPVRSVALGDLTGAWMLGAGVLFASACDRLARAPENTWTIGFLWGLLALIHPALLALGIPIFVFAAQAYRAQESSTGPCPGHAPLPSVPMSLLLSPAIAALVVITLWSLGGGSTRDLLTSVDHLWRQASPAMEAASFGASPGMAIWAGFASFGWAPTTLAAVGALLPGQDRQTKVALFLLATTLIAGGLGGRVDDPDANLMLFLAPSIAALVLRIPAFSRASAPA